MHSVSFTIANVLLSITRFLTALRKYFLNEGRWLMALNTKEDEDRKELCTVSFLWTFLLFFFFSKKIKNKNSGDNLVSRKREVTHYIYSILNKINS